MQYMHIYVYIYFMVTAPLILEGTQKFQTKIIGGDLSKKLN